MNSIPTYSGTGVLTGAAHLLAGSPGQDYALSGVGEASSWGVVCDGCSNGGPDVGLGAGALAKVVAARLSAPTAMSFLAGTTASVGAQLAQDLLPWDNLLGWENLLATAVMARREGNWLTFRMFGDGGFALFHRDGSLSLYRGFYENNAPDYLAYRLMPDWHAGLEDEPRLWVNAYSSTDQTTLELARMARPDPVWHFNTDSSGICGYALFTDGAESLRALSPMAVLLSVVAKKAAEMTIAQALGACSQDWLNEGTYPTDDLAIAMTLWA